MKCVGLAVLSLVSCAAFAQIAPGVPVLSPNRLSGMQAAAPPNGVDRATTITAGNIHDPLQIVDASGKVVGRFERVMVGVGHGATNVIFLLGNRTTRLWNLSTDCPSSNFQCVAGQEIRSTAFVFAAAEDAVAYASSDCSGTPHVINVFPGAEQSAVAVKEADGAFNLYVADVSGLASESPLASWFANGQCNGGAPPPVLYPSVGPWPHAYPVTMVVPASKFGSPPFHIE